jgi:YVTN family beta-propeller protein
VQGIPPRVYVPDNDSNDVRVINPNTFRVVRTFRVGQEPQHIAPAWNLRHLYVGNVYSNTLTVIDPRSGRPTRTISVPDPYNLYFSPDGRHAIDVAEGHNALYFYDPRTWHLQGSLSIPFSGPDHLDFSANGRYLLASCEFSSELLKVDIAAERVVGTLTLRAGAAPQDVKLSPDGSVFYVADMAASGVWLVDGADLRVLRFMPTGAGAHGLYPSRDARFLYVTNRNEGTISVLDFTSGRPVTKWHVGGSPDMGGVSADGKVLWLSGRYNAQVYAISTKDGRVLARIPVGYGPHGVCVWPQPGRYSLGHTGILR